ncbi:MAG: hypothetical protein IKU52_07320 [Clostridia bacterium]|nr:hypothetical protein [Clostridia bacterium]
MDKKYLKNVVIYILSAILSVLLIAYIVYHLVNSFSSDVETMAANIVTLSETYTAEAYIFRNEKVLYSDNIGSVSYLYDDGTKIGANTDIATVYSGNNTPETEARVSDIERQLSILKNSSVVQDTTVSDSSVIDARIDSLYYTIQTKINQGDIDYVLWSKDELLTLMNKRQLVLELTDGFSAQIAELENEKKDLTASMDSEGKTVSSGNVSGYLYSDVDGYESIFTAEAVDSFTIDDFYEMTESAPKVSENAVAKIATSYKWYIACEVPSVHQQYYTEGQEYTVSFPFCGGKSIPMKLYRIVTGSEQPEIILVFETGSVPEDFNFLRKQSVEIVQQSYTGYRIPVSAVRMVKGKQGVYVKSGNTAVFKEINPLVELDGYFIVEEQDRINDENYASKLGMYDLVIVKGKKMYENKIIQ